MGRKKRRPKKTPTYIEDGNKKEQEVNKVIYCPSCKNYQDIANMKGLFNCPDCGWELDTKIAE